MFLIRIILCLCSCSLSLEDRKQILSITDLETRQTFPRIQCRTEGKYQRSQGFKLTEYNGQWRQFGDFEILTFYNVI